MKILFVLLTMLVMNSFAVDSLKLITPYGGEVKIIRDDFGVPHIFADNEADLFFGQGFATAQDRLVQLHEHRIYSAGRTAEYSFMFDDNVNTLISNDVNIRMDKYSTDELEYQFSQYSPEMRTMIHSYTDGINRYLDSMLVRPEKYMDYHYSMLQQFGIEIEPWSHINTMEIIVYISRVFGAFGGNELYNLSRYQQMGEEAFNVAFPINDPNAFTTIHHHSDTGSIEHNYKERDFNIDPNNAVLYAERKKQLEEFRTKHGLPNKFGSFAAIVSPVKTYNSSGLFLGCPQMGQPQIDKTSLLNEVELNCPTYHAGGASVTGIPGLIIGRTKDFVWTFTSGVMDNTDLVFETLNEDNTKFERHSEFIDFEVRQDTIKYLDNFLNEYYHPVEFLRTTNGPVFVVNEEANSAISIQYTFWQKEFLTWESLYYLIKANDYSEVKDAISQCPISFNFFYMNKDREMKYHFLGLYPKRNFGVDPRLPRNGNGTEDWQEFYSFEELPHADFTDQDYFVNWNNKPAQWWDQGDDIFWKSNNFIDIGVRIINEYVKPFKKMTYQDLKDLPEAIDDNGTYQQAFEILSDGTVTDENILPPGQSGFTNINGEPSPHYNDQWDIFKNWEFKDMIFGDENAVSVEYYSQSEEFVQIMPNPAVSYVKIAFDADISGNISINIRDFSGREIIHLYDGKILSGNNEFVWNIDNSIPAGIYFYSIIHNNKIYTGKIIVH